MPVKYLEIIEAVNEWQNDEFLHPLTCGNDSNHEKLIPHMTREGFVVLKCLDCDYIQDWIPEIVLEHYNYKKENNNNESSE